MAPALRGRRHPRLRADRALHGQLGTLNDPAKPRRKICSNTPRADLVRGGTSKSTLQQIMSSVDHREHHVWQGPRGCLECTPAFGMSADGMEVAMATLEIRRQPANRVGVFQIAATGGVGAAVIFVLCWLGTFIPFASPTQAYIGLFTLADIQSGAALLEGSLWSLLFGGLSGAVIAAIYNMFARLSR